MCIELRSFFALFVSFSSAGRNLQGDAAEILGSGTLHASITSRRCCISPAGGFNVEPIPHCVYCQTRCFDVHAQIVRQRRSRGTEAYSTTSAERSRCHRSHSSREGICCSFSSLIFRRDHLELTIWFSVLTWHNSLFRTKTTETGLLDSNEQRITCTIQRQLQPSCCGFYCVSLCDHWCTRRPPSPKRCQLP